MAILPPRLSAGTYLGQSLAQLGGVAGGAALQIAGAQRRKQQERKAFAQLGLPPSLAEINPQLAQQIIRGLSAEELQAQKMAFTQAQAAAAGPGERILRQALLGEMPLPLVGPEAATMPEFATPPTGLPPIMPEEQQAIAGMQFTPEQLAMLQKQAAPEAPTAVSAAARLAPRSSFDVTKPALSDILTTHQAQQLAEIRNKEAAAQAQGQQLARKDIEDTFKLQEPILKEVFDTSKAATRSLQEIDRLDALNESGKLDRAGISAFLDSAGFSAGALRSPESQEFKKILAGVARNAKQYFGGRITNFELQQLFEGWPSLTQSKEGRKRSIEQLRYFYQSQAAEAQATREILKENHNRLPLDFRDQLDAKLEKKREILGKKLQKSLDKLERVDLMPYIKAKAQLAFSSPQNDQERKEQKRLQKLTARYEKQPGVIAQSAEKIDTLLGTILGTAVGVIPKVAGGIARLLGGH